VGSEELEEEVVERALREDLWRLIGNWETTTSLQPSGFRGSGFRTKLSLGGWCYVCYDEAVVDNPEEGVVRG
jgi:hypothetical protein